MLSRASDSKGNTLCMHLPLQSQAAMSEVVTMYRVWCPMTDSRCPRVTAQLAKKESDEEARAAVKHHLIHSSYHYMEEEDAAIMAEGATVEKIEEQRGQPQPAAPTTPPMVFQKRPAAAAASSSTSNVENMMTALIGAIDRSCQYGYKHSDDHRSSCTCYMASFQNLLRFTPPLPQREGGNGSSPQQKGVKHPVSWLPTGGCIHLGSGAN